MAANSSNEMEPIPLRTLTILLNYERMMSDTRLKGFRLITSSLCDPSLVKAIKEPRVEAVLGKMATTVTDDNNIHLHAFNPYNDPPSTEPQAILYKLHPDALRSCPKTRLLTPAQLESIFLETRSHSGCYRAVDLYHNFFKHCPKGQKISIQITNEEPLITEFSSSFLAEYQIKGPKQCCVTQVPPISYHTGYRDNECHCTLEFKRPGFPGDPIVVDMTMMQYGEGGRGKFGEIYFLGAKKDWNASMAKLCNGLDKLNITTYLTIIDHHDERTMTCAAKVFQRWQNRAVEGWCDYCGIPTPKATAKK